MEALGGVAPRSSTTGDRATVDCGDTAVGAGDELESSHLRRSGMTREGASRLSFLRHRPHLRRTDWANLRNLLRRRWFCTKTRRRNHIPQSSCPSNRRRIWHTHPDWPRRTPVSLLSRSRRPCNPGHSLPGMCQHHLGESHPGWSRSQARRGPCRVKDQPRHLDLDPTSKSGLLGRPP